MGQTVQFRILNIASYCNIFRNSLRIRLTPVKSPRISHELETHDLPIMVQPVKEMIFNSNPTERYKNIFRHENELKWIKTLQTLFPIVFNDNIYHEGNISKMPDFDVFSLLDVL